MQVARRGVDRAQGIGRDGDVRLAERAQRALCRSVTLGLMTDHEVGADGSDALIELVLRERIGLELGHTPGDELGLSLGEGVELSTSASVAGLEPLARRRDAGRARLGLLRRRRDGQIAWWTRDEPRFAASARASVKFVVTSSDIARGRAETERATGG